MDLRQGSAALPRPPGRVPQPPAYDGGSGARPPLDLLLENQNHIMGNLVFLLLAVAIIALGVVVLRMRQRGPSSVSSGVDSFAKGMEAIRPIDDRDRRGRR